MPNYSNVSGSAQSLQPGGIFYSFGSIDSPNQVETLEIIPAVVPQAGQRCALTQPIPANDTGGRAITYETEFDGIPGAVSVALQGAMRDVDSEYVTIDSNTGVALANPKTVTGVRMLFLRLAVESVTLGAATKMVGKILG